MNTLAFTCCLCLITRPAIGQPGDAGYVHDPSMIKAKDTYVLFSTGRGIPIRRSVDLVHWERAGQVFGESVPAWARREIPGVRNPWAPDISFFGDEFRLYYSLSTFGSQRSCIGLATNPTLDPSSPEYRWTDRGKVVESVPGRDDFNAIDPNIVLDAQGQPWLSLGSFYGGIKIVKIDPITGKPSPGANLVTIAARPRVRAVEAPFIVRRGDDYYLFVSFDFCCRDARSDYKIMVGRSRAVTGPYLDLAGVPMTQGGGSLLLSGYGRVRGPGHNAVLMETGGDLLVHHYYDAEKNGSPRLQVRPLVWGNDGFPMAGEPLTEPPSKPLAAAERVQRLTHGEWKYSVDFGALVPIRFLPGGKLNDALSGATWSLEGPSLTLRWPREDAPGVLRVDACVLAADGRSFVGRNQRHEVLRGIRSGDGP